MKKLVAVIVSLFISVNAYASANWVWIGTNFSKDDYFIDNKSMQKSGDSITFWQLQNYNTRQIHDVLSIKGQTTINCRIREKIIRFFIAYDDINGKGRTIDSGKVDRTWEPIAPDTADWHMMKFVCK